jgi:hypothetical protein
LDRTKFVACCDGSHEKRLEESMSPVYPTAVRMSIAKTRVRVFRVQ